MAISKALTRLGGGPSRCPTRRACRSPCHAKRPSLTAPSTNVSTDHHGRERADAIQVRVSEYQLNDGVLTGEEQQRYRLITTLLDADNAPATDLAALYPERWTLESALDEIKTHQRGPRVVLRSKSPDGVYQEAWGHLPTHYAIRRLMHDAALQADPIPHRLSFIRSIRAVRRFTRTQPGLLPPQQQPDSPASRR